MLLAALVSTRTCGAVNRNIDAAEAKELAKEHASFEPCAEPRCAQARYVQRGIPVRAFWAVVLSEKLDEQGQPNRVETFLVSVVTGDVSRP